MTALSAMTRRLQEGGTSLYLQAYPLGSSRIHAGAAVCGLAADGLAIPVASGLTSPNFFGFAEEGAATADGDTHVTVRTQGVMTVATITGATGAADIDTPVYMADDGDGFTTTSTSNVPIGKIVNFVGGKFRVRYQASARESI